MVDLRNEVQAWDQGAWCLAAVALALGPEGSALRTPASEVLATLGLPSTPAQAEAEHGMPAELLASQAVAPVVQVASLLRDGTMSWDAMPDEALIAQGRGSAQMVAAFRRAVLPEVPGLAEALAGSAPRMLDVGTGVGAMALEFADAFPGLRVTGVDVMPRALTLADDARRQHPSGDRVELVEQDVADLDRPAEFDLAWLPAPFIPAGVLAQGIRACARSLRPGGWLMMAHGKFGSDPVQDALNRFKTACYGGTSVDDAQATALLTDAGLRDLVRVATPAGAPALILGSAAPQ